MLIDKRAVTSGSLVRNVHVWFARVNAARQLLQPSGHYDLVEHSTGDYYCSGLDIDFEELLEKTKWLHLVVAALDRTRRKLDR